MDQLYLKLCFLFCNWLTTTARCKRIQYAPMIGFSKAPRAKVLLQIILINFMSDNQNRFSPGQSLGHPSPSNFLQLPFFLNNQENTPFQSNSFNKQRLNIFTLCLLKTKESILRQSITRIIECCPTQNSASKHLQQLNGTEVKDSIIENISKDLAMLRQLLSDRKGSQNDHQLSQICQRAMQLEEVSKLTSHYLTKLIESATVLLQSRFPNKFIYTAISFKWRTEFVKQFLSILTSTQKQKQHIEALLEKQVQINDKDAVQTKNTSHIKFNTSLNVGAIQNKALQLLRKIQSQSLSNQLTIFFLTLSSKLKAKQRQLSKYQTELSSYQSKMNQFQSIIKQQIQIIKLQEMEKYQLQQKISFSSSQLTQLSQKCQRLQNQLSSIFEQFQTFKSLSPPVPAAQSYYINPQWQKQQFQQKCFTQIIQLGSDLLLQRDQTKGLINIILQSIKLSHESLQDLGACKRYLYQFDRNISKLIKQSRSFDKINLDEVLIMKEDTQSLEESDYLHEMHKSSISTFSQDLDRSKHRRELELQGYEISQENND